MLTDQNRHPHMSTTAPVMDYKAGRYKHKDEMRFYTELMLETKAPE